MQKKAIKYLRFSSNGQSHGSIEWQDTNTDHWCKYNDVLVTDVFVDAGHSAKTFDRPDFDKLHLFIAKNHKQVDYLVVNEFDRFSRDAGEAISLVKKLQMKFNIQIVSVSEGIIYDYHTPGSHFRSGLQLLLAEDNNINRAQKINSGIYNAKTREQRFIGAHAPYGYKKTGTGKEMQLEIIEEQACIIREVFNGFLQGIPIYVLYKTATEKGMKRSGHSSIQKLLQNPIYSGQQLVKPWKNMPGGLFPAKHPAIIDMYTWQLVQQKFKSPGTKIIISEDLPLRGVLNCHCGRSLTGAASRGKMGNYFYYYKCNTASAHNNISAKFAHEQLQEIMQHLSLPAHIIDAIKTESKSMMQQQLLENKKTLQLHKKLLDEAQMQMISLEKKWINDQVNFETYNRWHSDITNQQIYLQSSINKLSTGEDKIYKLLEENLYALSDMQGLFNTATTTQKQQLVKLVFDNKLYYKDKTYRTPYLMEIFHHNTFILKQKQLLELDEKRDFSYKVPSGGAVGNTIEPAGTEPLFSLLTLIKSIRVA